MKKPQTFTIETRGAGKGGVGLSVVGPTEPKIGCVDNHDGTLTVEYLPDSPGSYEIAVTFAEQPVPGLYRTISRSCGRRTAGHSSCRSQGPRSVGGTLPWLARPLGTASPSTCGLHHCPEIHLRKKFKIHLFGCERS